MQFLFASVAGALVRVGQGQPAQGSLQVLLGVPLAARGKLFLSWQVPSLTQGSGSWRKSERPEPPSLSSLGASQGEVACQDRAALGHWQGLRPGLPCEVPAGGSAGWWWPEGQAERK